MCTGFGTAVGVVLTCIGFGINGVVDVVLVVTVETVAVVDTVSVGLHLTSHRKPAKRFKSLPSGNFSYSLPR